MPNFCGNLVNFSHSNSKMIERVLKANNEGTLFQEFVPCPEEPELGWYDWCCTNWGTKWDICNLNEAEIDDPNEIELFFDTAWSPPVAFYEKMEELGFAVNAYYYEPGCGFCGHFSEGEDDFYEIEGDSNWVKENVPEEIKEIFGIVENMEYWEQEDPIDEEGC